MVQVLIKLNGSWQPSVFKSLQDIPPDLPYKEIDDSYEGIETKQEQVMQPVDTYTMRKIAYSNESDPLYLEAVYKAFKNSEGADLSAWVAKIDEIKQRYPK